MSESFERLVRESLQHEGRAAWSETPVVVERASAGHAVVDGRDCILLCSNDYLGLATDRRVVEAARVALESLGVGARAARSLAGDTALHRGLERDLAEFKGTEAALLFSSGFACNASVIPALAGRGEVILSDELNHASIVDGCRLSRATTVTYRHADMSDLEAGLREHQHATGRMIVTDAVFSMDGDVAPLTEIVELANRYHAFIVLDEAHATGVLGATGKGTLEHVHLAEGVAVQVGTLGKALGALGGFVTGSQDLTDLLARRARSFLFTTSLPAPVVAAARQALAILRSEPERVSCLWDNARLVHSILGRLGYAVPPGPSPILPVIIGSDDDARELARLLLAAGVIVHAVGQPYVPAGTARLRVIVSASHTSADLERVAEVFEDFAPRFASRR